MSSTSTSWSEDSNTKADSTITTSVSDVSIPATSKLYFDGGDNTYLTESSADLIDIYTGGVKSLSITSNGSIGMGTDSPAIGYTGLTNAKHLSVKNVSGSNGSTVIELAATQAQDNYSMGSLWYTNLNNSSTDAPQESDNAKLVAAIPARAAGTGNDSGARLDFETKGDGGRMGIRMTVDHTGNVGVGSESPTTTLQVVGSFTTGLVTIAATDAITAAEHAGRINLLGEVDGNALVTLTLPDATGTGNVYKFVVSVVNTSNYKFVVPDADNTIDGQIMITDADLVIPNVYHTVAATDTIILNGTTTGGGSIGDYIELIDIAENQWAVNGMVTCPAGSDDATMFSETVS